MNDSLDLRNRILKMRESNNLIVTKKETLNNNLMSKFESSIRDESQKKTNIDKYFVNKKNEKTLPKLHKNNSEDLTQLEGKSLKNLPKSNVNDNEAQFLMLANKFNEAVEVILELSEKVQKLEKSIGEISSKQKRSISYFSIFNLKIFIYVLLISTLFFGFLAFPFDFSIIRLIINDIFSTL